MRAYPEYNKPKDPTDPESPMMWEAFDFELACAELCGKSHYSMRRIVRIVTEEEYQAWLKEQQSYYASSIRGKDSDPNKGKLLGYEITRNREALTTEMERALLIARGTSGIPPAQPDNIRLDHVTFETGSSTLTEDSKYQLGDLADIMKRMTTVTIEVSGHTDNTGDATSNLTLSQDRADVVKQYLVGQGVDGSRIRAVGHGQTRPVDTNDTEEGRTKNRRTEIRIISQ